MPKGPSFSDAVEKVLRECAGEISYRAGIRKC